MIAKKIFSLFALAAVLAVPAAAQMAAIVIPAGSDPDKEINAINAEGDPQKKIAMLAEFVQKFASDKMALAYGYQALAQQYQLTGDLGKGLDAADKAYAAIPNNAEIITTAVSIAQQAKNSAKAVEYAVKGAELIHSLARQPKPEGVSDSEFADQLKQQEASYQGQYDFYEAAGFNAITAEPNPKARMAYIDQFTPAFPKSKFTQQLAQYAMLSLQQMNEGGKMAAFGEKILASNPDDMTTLVLLASTFAEEPSGANLGKASQYARRAIELAKAGEAGADKQRLLSAGLGHSALGYVLLRQEKTVPAIAELKQASSLLKDDPAAHSTVLYRLGFAYAKLNRIPDAKAVLAEAVRIPGPFQQPSRELLEKVNAAKPRAGR